MIVSYFFSFHLIVFFFVLLMAQVLLGRRFPYVLYLLWTLFLVRLLIPAGLYTFDVYQLLDRTQNEWLASINHPSSITHSTEQQLTHIQQETQSIARSAPLNESVFAKAKIEPASSPRSIPWGLIYVLFVWAFCVIWLTISLKLLYTHFFFYRSMLKKIKESGREIKDGIAYELYLQSVDFIKVKEMPPLVAVDDDSITPCVIGLRKKHRKVVVPEFFIKKMATVELQIVFSHELSHIKQKAYLINVLRFINLVIFHYNPFRIIAERFVQQYQEINADLSTIHRIGLDYNVFIHKMFEILVFEGLMKKRKKFVPSLLTGNISLVQRLAYIDNYEQVKSPILIGLATIVFLAVLAASTVNITFGLSSLENTNEIVISEEASQVPFPEPDGIVLDGVIELEDVVKSINGLMWVMDAKSGIKVYDMSQVDQPTVKKNYSFADAVPDIEKLKAVDFTVAGNKLYVAFARDDFNSEETGRIDIFHQEQGALRKQGAIPHIAPDGIAVAKNYLWIVGAGFTRFDGSLEIYDVSRPSDPQFVDDDYFMYRLGSIHHSADEKEIYIWGDKDLYIYRDYDDAWFEQTIAFEETLIDVISYRDDSILILGEGSDPFSYKKDRYCLKLLRKQSNFTYKTESTTVCHFDNGFVGVLKIVEAFPYLFVSYTNNNFSIFQQRDTDFMLMAHTSSIYLKPFALGEYVFLFNPEPVYFTVPDLFKVGIRNWESF
ncbi:hypothetical protein GF373_10025 [bacterium]|nr:hypothetical protein [bacterium]